MTVELVILSTRHCNLALSQMPGTQSFLQKLVKRAQGGKGQGPAVAGMAVRCLCMLLTALPHFNYAADLLQVHPVAMASWIEN